MLTIGLGPDHRRISKYSMSRTQLDPLLEYRKKIMTAIKESAVEEKVRLPQLELEVRRAKDTIVSSSSRIRISLLCLRALSRARRSMNSQEQVLPLLHSSRYLHLSRFNLRLQLRKLMRASTSLSHRFVQKKRRRRNRMRHSTRCWSIRIAIEISIPTSSKPLLLREDLTVLYKSQRQLLTLRRGHRKARRVGRKCRV
jgi:hypothetical protein